MTVRRLRAGTATVLALALVWFGLTAPDRADVRRTRHRRAVLTGRSRRRGAGRGRGCPGRRCTVRVSIVLDSVTWGTRLDLACSYAPRPDQYELPSVATYVLVVRTCDGRAEQVGTWRSIGGHTMRLTAATAVRRSDIASVEVHTTSGKRVLELTA